MAQKIGLFFLIFCLSSCEKKYEIADVGGRTSDVSSYIKSGEYKAEFCKGNLERLIKTGPKEFSKQDEDTLQKKFENWVVDFNQRQKGKGKNLAPNTLSPIFAKTHYQYSYFAPFGSLFHVYRTDTGFSINSIKNVRLFIRLDEQGNFVDTQFSTDAWVINQCGDPINSEIQEF
ncbi:hypothetical protein [Soonwooa sp.]|uniref:hypothetical protein n=1 Tax=Soonwooa sp. TaxID=1938592 RepID=UPI00260C08C3|nr:hypothetical protein [Soonwooa sp.]